MDNYGFFTKKLKYDLASKLNSLNIPYFIAKKRTNKKK